jgi:hypothetical protein
LLLLVNLKKDTITSHPPHRYEHELRIKELEATAQVQHFKAKWKSEWEKRKKLHNMVSLCHLLIRPAKIPRHASSTRVCCASHGARPGW